MATIYQNGIQYSGSGEPLIYDDMGGATSTTDGVHGLVPAPSAGDNEKFLSGDGSWKSIEEYVTKTASGNPIEISDSASAPLVKCVSAITGYQDLHGYDKPWVGGAGKNKYGNGDKTFVQAMQNIVLDTPLPAGTYTFSAIVTSTDTDNSDCLIQFVSGSAIAASGRIWRSTSNNRVSLSFTWSEGTVDKLNLYAAASYVNGAGDTATYKDIQIESGSTATAYEPYSNICPITAYTEGKIEVRGKNLFDKNNPNVLNGYISGQGVITSNGNTRSVYVKCEPNSYYTVSRIAGKRFSVGYTTDVPDFGDSVSGYTADNEATSITIQTGADAAYLVAFIRHASYDTISLQDIYDSLQIEKSQTPTTYEPYTSTTHTTTYPSAIFRGSEDVVEGTETHDMPCVDLGTLTWSYNSTAKTFFTPLGATAKRYTASEIANALSEKFGVMSNSDITNDLTLDGVFSIHYESLQSWLNVRWLDYTVASDFTTAVTGTKLAYELATPTTSSVTPTNLPIKSLNGYSHIESSTGDMEIEYIAKAFSPITELVDSQISALQKMMELMLTSAREATMTASANYTAGTLIVACGALYKASTAISSGASLVVGTNITPTTIAAELAALA